MAWQIAAIKAGIALGKFLYSKWNEGARPKPPPGDRIPIPSTEEGTGIPLIYGLRRATGNVVCVGRNNARPIWNDAVGAYIAHEYRVAWQMVFGVTNSTPTAGSSATFGGLYVGDKRVPASVQGGDPAVYIIDQDEFYGGRTADGLGGGGLEGRMIFQGGSWNQVVHSEWLDVITSQIAGEPPVPEATLISGLRGQIVASFIGREGTGFLIGETPRLEPFAIEIYNPVSIPGFVAGVGAIGNGCANPASVLWNLLTLRGGVDESLLDVDSFAAAAETLEAEEHGCSFIWTGGKVADHVRAVENQIDGTIRRNRTTGLYELVLIRQDYDASDPDQVPVFTAADCIGQPAFSATTWAEVNNEVRVRFPDRSRNYTERSVAEQNGALIDTQLGRRRTKEISFPGVCQVGLAAKLAARELNAVGRPVVRVRVTFCRRAHRLRRGDVFRLQWPDRAVDLVFRCVRVGLGTLADGRVTVDALQDQFDRTTASFVPPETVGPIELTPRPIVDRIVTEAPRWIQQMAFDAGAIANVNAQHGYYLAAPIGNNILWRVRTTIGSAAAAFDVPASSYPGTFVVDADYAATEGPYDETTGIAIRALDGATLVNATEASIATTGANLFQIGGEILSYGSFSSLGGGLYELHDIGRGLLGTVPADHLDGAIGYFLPGAAGRSGMGAAVIAHGAAVSARTEGGTSTWVPTEDSPLDEFASRSRVRLPERGANLLVNSSKTPSALEEEGVTLTWSDRNATTATIIRGDAGDETLESGQTFDAVAYKGDGPLDGGAQVVLSQGISSHTALFALGAAGHGTLEVGVDTKRVVTMPDGSTPTLRGWQVPTWPILANHWRNLLLNPRFAGGSFLNWSTTSGTAEIGSASALGGAGYYLTAASGTATLDVYQERDLAGYLPGGYKAVLDFAAVRDPLGVDTTDTVTVYLYSKNAAGTILDTATYGPSSPATWAWQALEIAELDPDAVSIRVRVVLTAVGEFDTTATSAVTEFHLRVGQITDTQLSNSDFQAGVTDWDETLGTWQELTATPYGSPSYIRPNDGAAAQLRQDVVIKTGYEGGVAVLRCGRMNDAASDTGQVTLQALGAADAILASVSTSDEAITPTDAWARRHLALELPATTLEIRVQLDATRVSGTPLNSCFTDLDLRLHKHLDPDETIALTFATPSTQLLPSTIYGWYAAFPDVVAPNHAIFTGAMLGGLGTEPLLEVVGDAIELATAVVDQGRVDEVQTTTAYEMPARGVSSIRVAPVGTSFANFSSVQSWAVEAFFRVREPGAWDGAADLCGRVVGGVGWYLWVTYGGCPAVTLIGTAGSVTVTGSEVVTYGDLCGVGVSYDASTDVVSLVDALGAYTGSASAIGEFRGDDVGRFAIWGSGSGLPPFAGQVARAYLWRGDRPTASELATTLTYATTPAAMALTGW